MKKITLTIVITSLFVSALFGLNIVNAQEKKYPIEFASNTTVVKFSRMIVENKNQQLVLSGRVKRRSPNTHVFPGHIDVVVDGVLYENIKYNPVRLHKHSILGSKFNLLLPTKLPQGSTIKIKWHNNQSTQHMISAVFSTHNSMI